MSLSPPNRAFNIGAVVHLETTSNHTLCPAQIIPALQSLVSRHDALRAKVTPGDESTNHIPLFTSNKSLENFEVSTTTSPSNSSSWNWPVEEIRRPFDLSSQLFRFSFLQREPNKLSVCLSFHHIAVDGASIHTLLHELLNLLSRGSLPPHPPQLSSFLPLHISLEPTPEEGKRERAKRKWVNLMASVEKCPRLNPEEGNMSTSNTRISECVAIKCPPRATDSVNEIARHFSVSPTVVLTTIFSLAVKEQLMSSEKLVVIGCASENRRRSQRAMVGHTVSLLPLKINFPRQNPPSLADVVSQVKTGWSLIMEGGVSLIDLLSVLPCLKKRDSEMIGNQDRLYSASPLQIIFSFLPTPQTSVPKSVLLENGTLAQCRVEYPRSCDAQADLFLEVRTPGNWEGNEAESSYLFTWEFRSAVLNRERVRHLHKFTLDLLTSCHSIITSSSSSSSSSVSCGAGVDYIAHLPGGTEKCAAESLTVASYSFTGAEEKVHSITASEDEVIRVRGMRGVWVWPNPTFLDDQSNSQQSRSLTHSSHCGPMPLQLPLQISLVEGATTQPPSPLSPIQMFMETASAVPHRVVFRYGTKTLTYHQAMQEVEKLARVLSRKGVAPGNHVGLVMPPCPSLYIGLLAILRCGAAYVPLSLNHPPSILLTMLETSHSSLLLTDAPTLREKFPHYHGDRVCIDSDNNISDGVAPELPDVREYGDRIAYIIFTSGTTGTPKGVAITNKSLAYFLSNFKLVASPWDTEVTLAGCTVAWDGHILDSLGPLLNGSTLVIAPTLEISEGITFSFMSPSAASVVRFPASMRCLMVGGEAFTETCYENVKKIPKVVSVYGPTETSVFVSVEYVNIVEDVSRCFSNLGKPVPGVALMVCDSDQCPVALGREGELCISGPQVSSVGYYGNEPKTKKSFVQSRLHGYGAVYRTGDWTKMLRDGTIVFLGRTDDQVKLRGMRFHLHEVERVLRGHPEVKMGAVAVRNIGTPSAQLVGFATPKDIDPDSLFKFLRVQLPAYMVPSAITLLDEFPLKTEGKVDRRALLNLKTSGEERENEGEVRVQEGVAERLAAIFGKVLGQESYPVSGDFFTSGGQSLLLFRLLQLINSELESELSLSDLLQRFTELTPLSLAHCIQPGLRIRSEHTQRMEENDTRELSNDLTPSGEETKPTRELATPNTTEGEGIGEFDYLAPVPVLATTEFLQKLLNNSSCRDNDGLPLTAEEKSEMLKRESGLFIPPSSLRAYPNPASLQTQLKLRRLIDCLHGDNSPVVKLRPPTGGDDKPLIFVHGGIIGWPLPYLTLSRSLPVSSVAIQRCENSPTTSFEEMVAFYVDAVIKAQPDGPYRLVGVCYGAVMVYEVARQLTERGLAVELAVFVNHSPAIEKMPRVFDSKGGPLAGSFVDPIVFFRKILGLPLEISEKDRGEEGARERRENGEELEEKVERIVRGILTDSCWIPFSADELAKVYLGFFLRLRCAWRGYTPRPGAAVGHALLIRDHTHPLFHSHDFGLGSLLPGGARLTVAVAPQKMGLMSDPATFEFVRSQIEACLTPPSPTSHSVAGLE